MSSAPLPPSSAPSDSTHHDSQETQTRASTMNSTLQDFLGLMPKAELHVHLEGTLEAGLVRQLAARNNVSLPSSITALSGTEGYAFNDLASFLAVYYVSMTVLLTAQDFFDMTWAYLVKVHSQNVIHTEMFFDPQAHTSRGVPFSTVITGIRRAIIQAERELGISTALIMCFLRDMEAGYAMATLMEALPYKDWIIGVGLDSNEKNNPPSKFADVFKRAKVEGFLVTCHCDIDQENSIEHIRQAIEDIGVDRIDHGTNIVEDTRLIELAKKKGLGFTACPISNSVVYPVDFKSKEILQLLRTGIKITVNSDDPAYFRGYMTENMLKIANGTGITKEELITLQRNAFEISWISDNKRQGFLESLDAYTNTSKGYA